MQQFLGETPVKDQGKSDGKQEHDENKKMAVNLFGNHGNKSIEEDKTKGNGEDCGGRVLENSPSRY